VRTSVYASEAWEAEEAETATMTEMEMQPCDGTHHHLEHSDDLEIKMDLSWGTYDYRND
jgi:hypothetical protein